MTSADFIRQQGQKPAKEIQALAKAKLGRPISPEYVYVVRWADKKRAHKPPQKRATSTARMGVKTQAEATFMKLQLERISS